MNKLIKEYIKKHGIPDSPDMPERKREELSNDDTYMYVITDNLYGWYIKKRTPQNDVEELIIDYLTRMPHY